MTKEGKPLLDIDEPYYKFDPPSAPHNTPVNGAHSPYSIDHDKLVL